jgi:hypothetical protein
MLRRCRTSMTWPTSYGATPGWQTAAHWHSIIWSPRSDAAGGRGKPGLSLNLAMHAHCGLSRKCRCHSETCTKLAGTLLAFQREHSIKDLRLEANCTCMVKGDHLTAVYRITGVPSVSTVQQPDQQPAASGASVVGCRATGSWLHLTRSMLDAWPQQQAQSQSLLPTTCW